MQTLSRHAHITWSACPEESHHPGSQDQSNRPSLRRSNTSLILTADPFRINQANEQLQEG